MTSDNPVDTPVVAQADTMEVDAVAEEKTKKDTLSTTLKSIVFLTEKLAKLKDSRLHMGRILRQTAAIRKQLTAEALTEFVSNSIPASSPTFPILQSALEADGATSMEDDAATAGTTPISALPETEMYIVFLVLTYLTDQKKFEAAKALSEHAVQRLSTFNRRTLEVIASKIYFYYSWANENTGTLASIRSTLLALHRTAVLRHDEVGQEVLLNLLLRNYLHFNLYDQAEKLHAKAEKGQWHSSQQYCRLLYYLGRIRTIQLEYTDAKECLQQAARKAPASALGFRIGVAKWLVIVRLLLGEIPEHSEFQTAGMKSALEPYYHLTRAVRSGDMAAFKTVTTQYAEVFTKDKIHNLISRLHQNVIRTGLRRINVAYSRIHLKDIAEKLALQSVEDAEYIVAKAIRDGGIDATIDHAGGWVKSHETTDVYSTSEPAQEFHARIAFCLDIHNDAIKAMRFEPDAHKKKLESAEARKERIAQEQELAKAIQEDGDDL